MDIAPMRRHCPICEGSAEPGWVCEDHPDKPWEHDGCGGAGVPCICNPEAAVQWSEVFAESPNEASRPKPT